MSKKMDLVKFVQKLMNITIVKRETSEEYFSRVKSRLEDGKYSVSELGFILDRKDHPEDYLGDIRAHERKVVISPNKMYLRTEVLMLADFLISEKIPFRYKTD